MAFAAPRWTSSARRRLGPRVVTEKSSGKVEYITAMPPVLHQSHAGHLRARLLRPPATPHRPSALTGLGLSLRISLLVRVLSAPLLRADLASSSCSRCSSTVQRGAAKFSAPAAG